MQVMLISERTPVEHQHVVRFNAHDFHTLGFLLENPGARASALADQLHVAATTASSLIARMVRQGLVARTRDPADGRAVQLSLTDRGRVLAETIRSQDLRNMELFLSALTADDQDQLLALMDKVVARVAALQEER